MHSQLFILLLATITSVANGQSFPDEASLPGCGETCLSSVVNEASTFGCSDGSTGCLCAAPNFQNGVLDCASAACAADLYPSVTVYLASVCATAVATGAATSVAPAASSVAVTTSLPATSVPATSALAASVPATSVPATSVPATSVSAALSSSSILVATTSSLGDATAPTSMTSPILSQSTPFSPTTLTSSTITSSFLSNTTLATASTLVPSLSSASVSRSNYTIGATAATTSASQTSSTASASTSASTSATGLSAGAKAGIGIGAAVGAVAAIGAIVAFVIIRKHKSRRQRASLQSFDMFEPMPPAQRGYANENNSHGFATVSELELKSRRYEDMMPRHAPRNMI